MIKFYFVFLIYLQITHQFISYKLHQPQDSSSVVHFENKLFYQRNRRQLILDHPDNDAIIFRDDADADMDQFDNRRNSPNPSSPLNNNNKRPSSWLNIFFNPTTIQSSQSTITTTTTTTTTTTPLSIPGMETAAPRCEIACKTTPEYNPVCGDNNVTYFSVYRLKCAQKCGKRVQLHHLGACTRQRNQ